MERVAGTWAHAPEHRLGETGAFMVTCGTYKKIPYLALPERRDFFQALFFDLAHSFGFIPQAWSIMSNHYHFITSTPIESKNASCLRSFIAKLHENSAKQWNREDAVTGRKVWHNFWESHITFERSYLARLKYVHDNPVHHGVVDVASNYRWCSRSWLEQTAAPAFVKTLDSFKTNLLKLPDDY